jgi:hypothetical protein
VSGLTKSSCIADLDPTNCVCVKDLRSFALGSNEFAGVSGFTKLCTWVQRICVCEWVYEVKHLDPDLRS